MIGTLRNENNTDAHFNAFADQLLNHRETGIEHPRNSCTDKMHAAENQCFYSVEVKLK
jgi:hypothetical protein